MEVLTELAMLERLAPPVPQGGVKRFGQVDWPARREQGLVSLVRPARLAAY